MNRHKGGILGYCRIVFLVTILFVLLAIPAPKAFAANAVVSGACGETEFINALAAVQGSGGGTITFNCGSAPFTIFFTTPKYVTAEVTIDGGNLAVLSGSNATRLFIVDFTGVLTLKDLTVRNGNSLTEGNSFHGGAIMSFGSLTVDHCKFLYNATTTDYSGGAIYSGGPLTIQNNSEFAYNEGGGGGAVYQISGFTAQISDSSFHHNSAKSDTDGKGGALRTENISQFKILNSTFDHNLSHVAGGAIFIVANSKLEMADTTLTMNTSNVDGGAVYVQGTASITDTLIIENDSLGNGGGLGNTGTTTLLRTTIQDNTAGYGGGGIHNDDNTVNIYKSIITRNIAGSFGGGISNYTASVGLENSVLAHNEGASLGDEVYNAGNFLLGFSTIINFTSEAPGASIYNFDGFTTHLQNSIVQANGDDCFGQMSSLGYNISSDATCSLVQIGDKPSTNPNLGLWSGPDGELLPLPRPGSLAIDSGTCGGQTADLRSFTRPIGGICDIGALELQLADPDEYNFLPALVK